MDLLVPMVTLAALKASSSMLLVFIFGDISRAPPFITQSHNTSVICKASINIHFYVS